ncbi:LOW QUALITY PROTEIN: phenoloxidase-activating factor 3 [Nilaparvata lugens]|uniref:LOW QUALITY PROTEIN: phenoloxidase-activating factor 3 n=1 Tax=Nilaparvata lugens TaxID=108931 RepID=UPI00193C93BE|nr:LOW QUALITY PROTEIN: phenoloxidase-activating factor 3 [Nilaparvata lugens]
MINKLLVSPKQVVISIWIVHNLLSKYALSSPQTHRADTLGQPCHGSSDCGPNEWCYDDVCELPCPRVDCDNFHPPDSTCVVRDHVPVCKTVDELETEKRIPGILSCRGSYECGADQWCYDNKCDLACPKLHCEQIKPPDGVCVVNNHQPVCKSPSQLAIVDPTKHRNWRLVHSGFCGLRGDSKIFGGRDADLGEFPWMALVLTTAFFDYGETTELCGGSIINNRYILTAAHCVSKDGNFVVRVRLSEYNLESDTDCERNGCSNYIDYETSELRVHPDYRRKTAGSSQDPLGDIALVRTHKEIDFLSEYIRPICLEYGDLLRQDYTGELVTIIGWGAWGNRKRRQLLRLADRLQKANVYVLDPDSCETHLRHMNTGRDQPTNRSLCAGTQTSFSYIGDSGSPMTVVRSIGADHARTYLIGITSHSFNIYSDPGGLRRPTIYVRVAYYLKWILDTIHE